LIFIHSFFQKEIQFIITADSRTFALNMKQALTILILILLQLHANAQKPHAVDKNKGKKVAVKQNTPAKKSADTVAVLTKADSIIRFSKKYIGTKYCYGGENAKTGFDCAGFVCFVYKQYGIKLPRTADAQALLGCQVHRKEARPGDLIFFRGSNKRNKAVGHSGLVVENKDGNIRFISSTVNAGIHIDDLEEAYWKERFISIRRVIKDED
jgi:cell wall-associated NlpC family hydrolase